MAVPDSIRRVMGLDVYVGSFTRCYMHDWETIVQQVGRLQGIPVQICSSTTETARAVCVSRGTSVRELVKHFHRVGSRRQACGSKIVHDGQIRIRTGPPR